MRIAVKYMATYRKYLKAGQESPFPMEVEAGTKLEALLERLPLPPGEDTVALVNGRSAPPDQLLQEGDVVALFPAIAGG
jgi:molybdopterin converting factor small subunit